MLDFLFETPWWLPTIIFGAGLVVLIAGLRRGDTKSSRVGAGILALGLLVVIVSWAVETPRERAVNRTNQLVSAANRRDWTAFAADLDAQTNLYGLRGADQITAASKSAIESMDITNLHITGTDVTAQGTVIRVSIRLYSEQRGVTALTDWQLEFQNMGSGWALFNITALSNQQISEDRIRSLIPRQ